MIRADTARRALMALVLAASLAACAQQAPVVSASASGSGGPVGPSDLRSMDRAIMPYLQQPVKETTRDMFPEAPYSVMLQPDPSGDYARVSIDLDRDRNPDEKWIVESGDRIMRMISTKDDGVTYDVVLYLANGVWSQGS